METGTQTGARPADRNEPVQPATDTLPSAMDVLVVGYGPVGAAIALLLARQGVQVMVADKSTGIFMAPRAIALDNEAFARAVRGPRNQAEERDPSRTLHQRWLCRGTGPRCCHTAGLGERSRRQHVPERRRARAGTCADRLWPRFETLARLHYGGGICPRGRQRRPYCPPGAAAAAARQESWEELDGGFLPRLVPVGWAAVVRPDKTIVHDGPATDVSRIVRESLALLVIPVSVATPVVETAIRIA